MSTPRDPFSDSFDSIEIDPAKAPSAETIDRALAFCAPSDDAAPGFYLIDNAQGRFIVDHDTGVVSLRDAGILDAERGQTHLARLRVVEASGHAYTIELSLLLTGAVPQMSGSDDLSAFFGAPPSQDPHGDSPERVCVYDYEEEEDDEPVVRIVSWAGYTATKSYIKPALGSEHAPFGTLIELWIPNFDAGFASLTMMDEVLAPNRRTAIWSV
jgi:hypothetical protein